VPLATKQLSRKLIFGFPNYVNLFFEEAIG